MKAFTFSALIGLTSLFATPAHAQQDWTLVLSDGVTADLVPGSTAEGQTTRRLQYDFTRGAGYAIARLPLDAPLPENFRLAFDLRGSGPRNNLEIKLVGPPDADGTTDVWWIHRPAHTLPDEWTRETFKRRHFRFAWGPAGPDAPPTHLSALEIGVAAFDGGTGFVEFTTPTITPIEPDRPYDGSPTVDGRPVPADGTLAWTPDPADSSRTIEFGKTRELGAVLLHWSGSTAPAVVEMDLRGTDGRWRTTHAFERALPGVQGLSIGEQDAEAIRLRAQAGLTLDTIEFVPPAEAPTLNRFLRLLADRLPRGWMPRMFHDQHADWTVFGLPDDPFEGLLDADGRVELDAGGPSIEPILTLDGRPPLTWADGRSTPSLADDDLPMPRLERSFGTLSLHITPIATGEPGASMAAVRYRVENRGTDAVRGSLMLAVRPVQVLPWWQELNRIGGAAPVRTAEVRSGNLLLNGTRLVESLTLPDTAFAGTADGGEPAAWAAAGTFPVAQHAEDPAGRAWAGWSYGFDLPPGESTEIILRAPWSGEAGVSPADPARWFALAEARERARWREALSRVRIDLGGDAGRRWADAARTTLGWILVNMDGPATQPGSRTYERAWIRDGAITGTALMSMGYGPEVGTFAEWYAGYQYESGKVPCVVDRRGPDPVDEHDSTGQLIHVIWRQARVAGETERARRLLPSVRAGVEYLDGLRQRRLTDAYRGTKFWGLVPESISHEGYAAKPMHSYWDGFFVVLGLKDAEMMARTLGDAALAERAGRMLDEYRAAMYDSMRMSMAEHGIDSIPGCAELGDFDPPSTAIGVDPVGELGRIPEPQLHNTFDRYWAHFLARREGRIEWREYSAYEMRIAAALVRMGQLDRAWEQLDWMLADQRPTGWNQWPEISYRDPTLPAFVGDMPHTWVAAGFVNALAVMLAYEDDDARTLVVGAGLRPEWLDSADGVRVRGLGTVYGPLNLDARVQEGTLRVVFGGLREVPEGGVLVRLPAGAWQDVRVDGRPAVVSDGSAVVHSTAAELTARR